MNISIRFILAGISIVIAMGLASCEKQESAQTSRVSSDLAIDKTSDKMNEEAREPGAKNAIAIDDSAITAKVKTALQAEPGLTALKIRAVTLHGVTTLSGSVDSQKSLEKAKEVVAAVVGVKSVETRLTVTPTH